MPRFFQRLLGRKPEITKLSIPSPERVESSAPYVSRPIIKLNALYAFVDLKDPFAPGDVAGEDLPGPILSILTAREISLVHLFHTPHTRDRAVATGDEIKRRYPRCSVRMWEIPVSDPKDYSSLMGKVAGLIRHSIQDSDQVGKYVCVSSGTAEMRAVWFLLTAIGVLRATLLQVGSPAQPLFGAANVKEVQFDIKDWYTLRDLMMPSAYFGPDLQHRTLGSHYPRVRLGASPSGSGVPNAGEASPKDTTSGMRAGAPAAARRPSLSRKEQESQVEDREPISGAFAIPEIQELTPPGLDKALHELGIHISSAVLRHSAEKAAIAAESELPVLLLGETGTGKERFAQLIHRLSPRSGKEMVAINCAAIPESIAESYLFGHMKGSFSGATVDKPGMFEHANSATLFLDEIAELSLEVQAKLLRVIQDGLVQRIGAVTPRKVDVRIIAATNRDLAKEVAAGGFRQDLYFRLEVVSIKLPTLRDRRNEIPELALALLKQINQRRHKPRQLSKQALQRLEAYSWPGNVRELSNVLERSVLFARGDVVDADDLLITTDQSGRDLLLDLPEPFPGFSIEEFLAQVRKQLFLRALAACNGNQAEAAALLSISKQAVSKFVAGNSDNAN